MAMKLSLSCSVDDQSPKGEMLRNLRLLASFTARIFPRFTLRFDPGSCVIDNSNVKEVNLIEKALTRLTVASTHQHWILTLNRIKFNITTSI